jgi:hypothetical protein
MKTKENAPVVTGRAQEIAAAYAKQYGLLGIYIALQRTQIDVTACTALKRA